MLKKLIKYDFKFSAKYFLLAYIIFGVLTLLGASSIFLLAYGNSIFNVIAVLILVIYFIVFGCMFVLPMLISSLYFYQQCVSPSAYLTFTLPVTTKKILFSKLFVCFSWACITYFTIFLSASGLIAVTGSVLKDNAFVSELIDFVIQAFKDAFTSNIPYLVMTCIVVFISFVAAILLNHILIFFAMGIGQTASRQKFLMSALCYIILNVFLQIANAAITFAAFLFIGDISAHDYYYTVQLLVKAIPDICFVFGAFFLTNRLFTKKLNL